MSFDDNSLLPVIYGDNDRFLRLIEKSFDVSILTRGNFLKISGNEQKVQTSQILLNDLFEVVKKNNFLDDGEVIVMINLYKDNKFEKTKGIENIDSLSFTAGKKSSNYKIGGFSSETPKPHKRRTVSAATGA